MNWTALSAMRSGSRRKTDARNTSQNVWLRYLADGWLLSNSLVHKIRSKNFDGLTGGKKPAPDTMPCHVFMQENGLPPMSHDRNLLVPKSHSTRQPMFPDTGKKPGVSSSDKGLNSSGFTDSKSLARDGISDSF